MKKRKKLPHKGVKYIAKALVKYQKGQYSSYNKALPKAREIFSTLKTNKETVKLKNIWKYSRKRKTVIAKPLLDPMLSEPSFYFELTDYPLYISRSSNEIWFTSKLWPDHLQDIQGGTLPDYNTYFAPYVNFINSASKNTSPQDKRYETDWLVTCTPPTFNTTKKRWETKIISIDGSFTPFDYGFDPKNPSHKPASIILSTSSTGEPKEPEQIESETSSERVAEIRQLIADLRQDVKEGLLSKEDYAALVKDLTSKMKKGGGL